MRGESGEDLGRCWGDLVAEVGCAIVQIGNSNGAIRKLEGKDWKVYAVGETLIRADVKVRP